MSTERAQMPESRLISDGAPRNRAIVVCSEAGKSARAGWHPSDQYWMDRSSASPGAHPERVPFKVAFWREMTPEEKQDHDDGRPFSDRTR